MKKSVITLVALAASLTLSAQNKGDMYVSGSLSVSGGNTKSTISTTVSGNETTTKTKNPSATRFSFAPSFGYFITDNLVIEGSISYGLTKNKNYTVSTQDKNYFNYTHSFSIGPRARYYVKLGSDKFYYTPGAAMSFGFNQERNRVSADTVEKPKAPFTFDIGIYLLAFEFKPVQHIGIAFSAGSFYYSLETVKNVTTTDIAGVSTTTKNRKTQNNAGLGLNTDASISFRYYF